MISTAGTGKRSRRFIQLAHIKISCIFAIFFPSLADSGRAFLAPLSGIHPAAVSFSLMEISPPRSRPDTLESVSSFLPPVIATVGCCPPTVGFSSYGSLNRPRAHLESATQFSGGCVLTILWIFQKQLPSYRCVSHVPSCSCLMSVHRY